MDRSKSAARMQGIRESAQDLVWVDVVIGGDVSRGDVLVRGLVPRGMPDPSLAEGLLYADVIEREVFGQIVDEAGSCVTPYTTEFNDN